MLKFLVTVLIFALCAKLGHVPDWSITVMKYSVAGCVILAPLIALFFAQQDKKKEKSDSFGAALMVIAYLVSMVVTTVMAMYAVIYQLL